MKRRLLALIVIAVMVTSLLGGCGSSSGGGSDEAQPEDKPEVITVVDDAGRTVEITLPIERAAVINQFNLETVRAIGAMDKVCAISGYSYEDEIYWHGDVNTDMDFSADNDFDIEKMLALDPQVIIMPRNNDYEAMEKAVAEFGIPVVVVTAWDNDVFLDAAELLGQIFQKEEGAQRVKDFYNEIYDAIQNGLKDVPEDARKTVYWESVPEYVTCMSNSSRAGYFNSVKNAGGINLFEGVEDQYVTADEVDPEAIVEKDPECIVKICDVNYRYYSVPPTEEEYMNLCDQIAARPGFDTITAVKEGNIYIYTNLYAGALGKMIGGSFIAKCLYPEQMANVDPEGYFRRWITEFQGCTDESFVEAHTFNLNEHQ